jgi:hypothetical protein
MNDPDAPTRHLLRIARKLRRQRRHTEILAKPKVDRRLSHG